MRALVDLSVRARPIAQAGAKVVEDPAILEQREHHQAEHEEESQSNERRSGVEKAGPGSLCRPGSFAVCLAASRYPHAGV